MSSAPRSRLPGSRRSRFLLRGRPERLSTWPVRGSDRFGTTWPPPSRWPGWPTPPAERSHPTCSRPARVQRDEQRRLSEPGGECPPVRGRGRPGCPPRADRPGPPDPGRRGTRVLALAPRCVPVRPFVPGRRRHGGIEGWPAPGGSRPLARRRLRGAGRQGEVGGRAVDRLGRSGRSPRADGRGETPVDDLAYQLYSCGKQAFTNSDPSGNVAEGQTFIDGRDGRHGGRRRRRTLAGRGDRSRLQAAPVVAACGDRRRRRTRPGGGRRAGGPGGRRLRSQAHGGPHRRQASPARQRPGEARGAVRAQCHDRQRKFRLHLRHLQHPRLEHLADDDVHDRLPGGAGTRSYGFRQRPRCLRRHVWRRRERARHLVQRLGLVQLWQSECRRGLPLQRIGRAECPS